MKSVERSYQVRGKEVRLQELVDLVAVRAQQASGETNTSERKVDQFAPKEALAQVQAFENAGWAFVPRAESLNGAKVFLKSGDRIALGTNRLSVGMAPDLSGPDAEKTLQQLGFQVVDRLKMAPNLFIVTTPDSEDPLEAAARLAAQAKVQFAEPELVEVVSGR
jgi:hypothetical protein